MIVDKNIIITILLLFCYYSDNCQKQKYKGLKKTFISDSFSVYSDNKNIFLIFCTGYSAA